MVIGSRKSELTLGVLWGFVMDTAVYCVFPPHLAAFASRKPDR